MTDIPTSVDCHYLKSNSFRVVHADGVWGGTTPRGYIAMSFFSERAPIPRKLTYAVNPDGVVDQKRETGRDSRAGIIREVEVEVMVDLAMAKSLSTWLQQHIGHLEENVRVQQQKGE